MQTNARLFTDRQIHANLPADDATGSLLETLAHAALVFILVGAFILTGQNASAPASSASAPASDRVAEVSPSPAPVMRSL